jgi:DNA polymerase-4
VSGADPWPRVILLADMNAFFASVEQLDHPEWRRRPIALTNGELGTCIITCSYEARARGVRTGMHIAAARKLCPGLIRVGSRPRRYAEVSTNIMHALARFTPEIEIFSVDEAFLDVTRCQQLWGSPRNIALRVKQAVFDSSGVHCSIGVGGDKTTAKFAAKQRRPDGLTVIPPWQARARLAEAPLNELCGVNSAIAALLARYGVERCGDLQKLPISVLGKRFGNPGRRIWLMAQGLDPEPVRARLPEPRSLGHGKVLPPNTRDAQTLRVYLMHMAHKLGERLRANRLVADRFQYGLRLYQGWLKTTRRSLLPSDDEMVIYRLGEAWLRHGWNGQGIWQIHVAALDPGPDCQRDMFQRKHPARQRVHGAMDRINARYGAMTLASARLLQRSRAPDVISPAWKPQGHRQSL